MTSTVSGIISSLNSALNIAGFGSPLPPNDPNATLSAIFDTLLKIDNQVVYNFSNTTPNVSQSASDTVASVITLNGTLTVNGQLTLSCDTSTFIGCKRYFIINNLSTGVSTEQLLTITTGISGAKNISIPIQSVNVSSYMNVTIVVDKSGNVYTEAGIESGSNSSGSWIKFADGNMWQWGAATIAITSTGDLDIFLTYLPVSYYDNFISIVTNQWEAVSWSTVPIVKGSLKNGYSAISIHIYAAATKTGATFNWNTTGRWRA